MIQFIFFFLFDLYVFSGVLSRFKKPRNAFLKVFLVLFWVINLIGYLLPIYYKNQSTTEAGKFPMSLIFGVFILWFLAKFSYFIILIINDITSLIRYAIKRYKYQNQSTQEVVEEVAEKEAPKLSRSQFLLKTGALVAAVPAATMTWGIVSGAHDYRVRRQNVKIKGLPKSFNGLRLAQISDIHSGSFWNKTAVSGGIDLLNAEKPDIVCFTGDLVNSAASEMNEYMNIFNKIKADMGVYSVIGNHDYGSYVKWGSEEAKAQNFEDLKRVHKDLGWDLLLNENRILEQGGEKLALVGVENWSTHRRFPVTGDLNKALIGTEEASAKLLMSHDPTHWRGEVLEQYKDIALTMSGHTHGMQFGIETENFKWSPIKYIYPEWAGLYQEGEQNLYVNRGYGYLGYPGRFGILPEITILTLESV